MSETGPDATPWEPPLAGSEAEQLLGALERLWATFRWKAGGVHADGLPARTGASTLTLGGLLKHLALVEDSVRRLVPDVVEEHGRHTGHADPLREAVDGRVGEHPPPGWRPAPA